MPVRVAIVDDDSPYRAAISALLALEPSFELTASFASAKDLLARLPAGGTSHPWDLVLMDIEMPGVDGISATAAVKKRFPGLPVVMLTSFEEADRIVRAILAGADGYLVKRWDAREVIEEIRAVVAGGSPMTPSVARSILNAIRGGLRTPTGSATGAGYDLTDREAEVLRALVAGKGYKEIAFDLEISIDTVRSHIRKIYRKLRVHSAPEAVAHALREGIV
jgi:DNA-binding NarL/FixJ family response regulator